ncbi:MAG: hypothetical protein ACI9XO_002946 [Paraglaciecola sp.]|jgi:hypothetical protein
MDGYFSPEVTGLGSIIERGSEIPDGYKTIIEEYDNRDQPFSQIELSNTVFFDGYSTEYLGNMGYFNKEYGLVGFKLNGENLWVFDRFE